MPAIDDIKRITEVEFADIVKSTHLIDHKLRIILINKGFVDVHLSQRLSNKFGFHWECMDARGTIYRYDNFPDKNWQSIATFPHHFHNGSQNSVEASPFPLTTIDGFRAVVRQRTDGRAQMTENRARMTDDRGQMTEHRIQSTEG